MALPFAYPMCMHSLMHLCHIHAYSLYAIVMYLNYFWLHFIHALFFRMHLSAYNVLYSIVQRPFLLAVGVFSFRILVIVSAHWNKHDKMVKRYMHCLLCKNQKPRTKKVRCVRWGDKGSNQLHSTQCSMLSTYWTWKLKLRAGVDKMWHSSREQHHVVAYSVYAQCSVLTVMN